MQKNQTDLPERISKLPLWKVGLGLGVILILYFFFWPNSSEISAGTLFEARRGSLTINVLEGGECQALLSQEIRSEIKGREGAKILSIVEEGTLITEKDIKDGLILVELDSSGLENQITSQEITFQSTQAAFIEAQQALEIQISQNESDVKAAEQTARFARLDFEKYLGTKAANEIIGELKLDEILNAKIPQAPTLEEMVNLSRQPSSTFNRNNGPRIKIDFAGVDSNSRLISTGNWGGGNKVAEGGERGNRRGGEGFGQGRGGGGNGERQGGRRSSTPEQMKEFQEKNPEMYKRLMERMAQGGGSGFGGQGARNRGEGGRNQYPSKNSSKTATAANQPALSIENIQLKEPIKLNSTYDFSRYTKEEEQEKIMDGAAGQLLRSFQDSLLLRESELAVAQENLLGSERLNKAGFYTETQLKQDRIAVTRSTNQKSSATTDLELFKKYDLQKEAEQFLALYEEALRGLIRSRKEAIAKKAQADAKFQSAQQRFRLEKDDLNDLRDQFSKCEIKALTTGLVVYGGAGSGGGRRFMSMEEQIREGATVRERQLILRIPDMTKMEVEISVHETVVKKVNKGLRCNIVIDAEPDKMLTGYITKVSPLPDSQNRFMNPDLKVYKTKVSIEGSHSWLKPGMSAKVEIIVSELENVVYIPVQAVSRFNGTQVCYIKTGGRIAQRKVKIGEFNDEFIEIKDGIKEGEMVLLRVPDSYRIKMENNIPSDRKTPEPDERAKRTESKATG